MKVVGKKVCWVMLGFESGTILAGSLSLLSEAQHQYNVEDLQEELVVFYHL